MILSYDTDEKVCITKEEFSFFYDMCSFYKEGDQSCFCEFVEAGEKCFVCLSEKFINE